MNRTLIVQLDLAPIPEWIPWAATLVWFSALFLALAKADQITAWTRYYLSRRQSRRWQNAGNLERREIIRPGRWQ